MKSKIEKLPRFWNGLNGWIFYHLFFAFHLSTSSVDQNCVKIYFSNEKHEPHVRKVSGQFHLTSHDRFTRNLEIITYILLLRIGVSRIFNLNMSEMIMNC